MNSKRAPAPVLTSGPSKYIVQSSAWTYALWS